MSRRHSTPCDRDASFFISLKKSSCTWPRAGFQLAAISCGDSGYDVNSSSTTVRRCADGKPVTRSACVSRSRAKPGRHREASWRPAGAAQILQHVHHDIASKTVRTLRTVCRAPRPGNMGPLCRAGGHPRSHSRGGQRICIVPAEPRLSVEHARVGLIPSPLLRSTRVRSSSVSHGWPQTAMRPPARSRQLRLDNIEDYYLNPWELATGHSSN